LGDSYYSDSGGLAKTTSTGNAPALEQLGRHKKPKHSTLKQKDLIGIPWRVAFALQQDGWYLRQDIIWHKPAPMPESATDRCTKAHEYIFLLTKSERYYYDSEAIKEPVKQPGKPRKFRDAGEYSAATKRNDNGSMFYPKESRNKRSVWTVNPKPFKEAHFAVFPPELIEPCVLAGAPEGGMVCDIFAGSGTTGEVALRANRNVTLIEMNPDYVEIMKKRLEPLRSQRNII
jgi:DNA modification methylase